MIPTPTETVGWLASDEYAFTVELLSAPDPRYLRVSDGLVDLTDDGAAKCQMPAGRYLFVRFMDTPEVGRVVVTRLHVGPWPWAAA